MARSPNALFSLPFYIVDERLTAMSIVEKGSSIVKERKGPHCVVIFASAVAKKRSRTNGSICVSSIGEKCPGAHSRVEAATGKPTAVLYPPVASLNSAFCPSAVLPPG
jgi:hypothetical protein